MALLQESASPEMLGRLWEIVQEANRKSSLSSTLTGLQSGITRDEFEAIFRVINCDGDEQQHFLLEREGAVQVCKKTFKEMQRMLRCQTRIPYFIGATSNFVLIINREKLTASTMGPLTEGDDKVWFGHLNRESLLDTLEDEGYEIKAIKDGYRLVPRNQVAATATTVCMRCRHYAVV